MVTTRASRITLAAVACALLAAGCSSGGSKIRMGAAGTTTTADDGSTLPPAGDTISWGSCADVEIAVTDDVRSSAKGAGMQCATVSVPVDHADPDGTTIDLAVAMLPATGKKAKRIGSLIVNPGGPGGSGLEFLAGSALGLPADWRERFDIVSFDPRGIAASTPLDCLTQKQRETLVDAVPSDDPATALADADAEEKEVAAGCAADDPELFANMGTDEVAADLDDLRAALGDEQLTFLGLSYGTRIAAAYATAFPDKVRALVLDGSVTPSRDLVEQQAGQVKGISRALQTLVDRCNADATCPLAPDAMARFDSVATKLDAAPLALSGKANDTLTKDKFVTGVVTALYDPSLAGALAEAVAILDRPDDKRSLEAAAFLDNLAGRQSSKQPDGTYGNGFETQSVVNCLDADSPLDGAEVRRARELAGPIPKVLDSDPATDTPSCVHLPTGDGLSITATAATPHLLVVGTEGDPATPIEWTNQMVTALGSPAAIVYGGTGHTASLSRKCVTEQVTAFLVSGTVSAPQNCPRDPEESDIYAQIAAQFETMGLGPDVGTCIADAIKGEVDPLGIVGLDGDNPDPDVITRLQRAALGCR